MSAPTRPLVTIDDPITIIEPHRVLLEWVEIVERQGFRVRSRRGGQVADPVYSHDQEGVVWARGHHLPDSEIVGALYAAAALEHAREDIGVREKPAELMRRVLPTAPPPIPADSYAELMRKMMEEQQQAQRWGRRNPPWWKRWTG